MTHEIECPSCAQHIKIEIPDPPAPVIKGPIQVLQPVEVTVSSNTVLKIVIYILMSLILLGAVVGGGLLLLSAMVGGLG